ARWLLRDEHDAEDVVQEAYLRAFRFFAALRGADAKPWLLGIVRNACYDWLSQRSRREANHVEFDELQDSEAELQLAEPAATPEALLARRWEGRQVNEALASLPPPLREVLILREIEELSYEDIARIAGIPIGTVMSRLSRGRARLRAALSQVLQEPLPTRSRHEGA
ncbi:MAG TPA: sigma-70 family RNA polymerase sigma factor, partial [Methylibium sp.]